MFPTCRHRAGWRLLNTHFALTGSRDMNYTIEAYQDLAEAVFNYRAEEGYPVGENQKAIFLRLLAEEIRGLNDIPDCALSSVPIPGSRASGLLAS